MNRLQRLFFMAGAVPNRQNYIVLGVTIASFALALIFGVLAISYNIMLWRLLFIIAIVPGMVLVLGSSYRLVDWSLSNKQERARIEKDGASRLVRGWLDVEERNQKNDPSKNN